MNDEKKTFETEFETELQDRIDDEGFEDERGVLVCVRREVEKIARWAHEYERSELEPEEKDLLRRLLMEERSLIIIRHGHGASRGTRGALDLVKREVMRIDKLMEKLGIKPEGENGE